MRANGVPNFPDPGSGGGLQFAPGSGLNRQSPAFQAARRACGKLQPGGGPGPRKATRAQFVAALAFARCMRRHGLPHFPDPLASVPAGSGPVIVLGGMMFQPGPGLDPQSPRSTRRPHTAGSGPRRVPAERASAAGHDLPAVAHEAVVSSDRVISRYSASVTASRLCPGAQ